MRGGGLVAALLVSALLAPHVGAQDEDAFGDVPDVAQVRAYLDQDVHRPGTKARVAVEIRIDPRIHINSQSPVTEFQFPTSLVWEVVPEGIRLSEITWPAPKLMSFEFTEGERIDVWEGTVIAHLTAELAAGLEAGSSHRIVGTFKAQGCTDAVCYAPQTDPVRFTVRVAEEGEEPEAINESKFGAGASGPLADGGAADGGEAHGGAHEGGAVHGGAVHGGAVHGGAPGGGAVHGGEAHGGVASMQAPTTVAASMGADGAEPAPECDSVAKRQDFNKPLPLLYLLAFGTGLLMTLTPCVLPLVPITIGYFSRQSQAGGRPVGLATVYVLGLALVYSVLGTVAGLTGDLFGNALQNPYVLVGIAAMLVGLATSMFGLWDMQLPAAFTSRMGGARSGHAGAFMMGGAMGLIAAPCVGPGVIGLLTYVGKLGADPDLGAGLAALIGGTLFFCLALGLGLPFFLVGLGVATINPGQWMESIKRILGFLILFVALYFLTPLLSPDLVSAVAVLLALVLGVYLFLPRAAAGSPRLVLPFRALGVLAIAGGLTFAALSLAPASDEESFFQPYSDKRLADARAAGKPVLIDFWATWCAKCIQLDRQTFSQPEVREALAGHVVLKADMTKEDDPRVLALNEKYRIVGLPTLVFLDPDGEELVDLRLNTFESPDDFILRVHCAEAVPIASR